MWIRIIIVWMKIQYSVIYVYTPHAKTQPIEHSIQQLQFNFQIGHTMA